MTQEKRRTALIQMLLSEKQAYREIAVPDGAGQQKQLLRSLMNIREPLPVSDEFLAVQDEYLQEETRQKGITDLADLTPVQDSLYLWRGDITTLRCDAIVNAANSGMTGCYHPCHECIDNCIHTFAGVQLRLNCAELMQKQGREEPPGRAKITPAYNLPSRFILHTVGPVITGNVTRQDRDTLASCYRSCLTLAEEHGVQSLAFCCISTGVFRFPREEAAKIAVTAVKEYLAETGSEMKVVWNVYQSKDYEIYRDCLG